ncbi:carbohydrate ABC transporter permease [Cellulomonas composti]|uniref:Sugar ABC transporter permease n=1 Tax=Cellulomonas composti TaxID=266130 RepID=A0A511J9V2_9CELL|nr:sugar ABC transporter permease [Cellulomonas composti]GEL94770.1 sugar ABC transporter permease [Cellulomonas composti]
MSQNVALGVPSSGSPAPAAGPAAQVPVPSRRTFKASPYLLLIPAVVILLLGLGYPIYWQILNSMRQYGLEQQFGQPAVFVGLDNFVRVFTAPDLWAVVVRSIAFCLVNAFLTVALGLGFALLMRAVNKVVRIILQVSLLLAWAMPMVAAVTVFKWLFDFRTGVVNWFLTSIGLDFFQGFSWLAKPWSFFFVATVIIVWMSVPFVALSIYAGLTSVPDEVLEAARIDGAGPWNITMRILLPMIRPVISIVLLLQIIWDLRVFAQINLLQQSGAPVSETNLLGNFIYQMGIGKGDFGGAAAVALFVLALTVVLSWPYVRSLMKEDAL